MPKAQLEVTQYDLHACHCSKCGQYQQGKFPSGVNARVQYGSGVRALSVLLHTNFQLPLKKIKILFGDLFGYELNQSSTLSAIKKCYEQLQKSEALIKKQLTEGSLSHFDESGLRVEGKLHWLHVASNEVLTYLFVHQKRGKLALEDQASVLPNFKGWAIHDCWASYFKFDQCKHAICGAHLIRELIALEENGSEWAACFRTFLFSLYELTDQGRDCLNSIQKQYALHTFHDIWKYANDLEPMPEKKGKGRPKATKGRNLLNRLKVHLQAVLAFAFHQQVPFTNNQAERDIRPIKTKLKVAGCFRTFSGAQRYARIQGFISSARKNNKHVLNEIIKALNGKDTFIHDLIPC